MSLCADTDERKERDSYNPTNVCRLHTSEDLLYLRRIWLELNNTNGFYLGVSYFPNVLIIQSERVVFLPSQDFSAKIDLLSQSKPRKAQFPNLFPRMKERKKERRRVDKRCLIFSLRRIYRGFIS